MTHRKFVTVIILALLLLPTFTQLAIAGANSIPSQVMEKIDPALYGVLLSEEPMEVVVRVKPLPSEVAVQVKGKYRQAIDVLKAWAEFSQGPVVRAVQILGGRVINRFWLDNVILVEIPGREIVKLASMPEVVRIFRNFEVRVIEPVVKTPVDPKEIAPGQVSSWGIFKIRAPEVWAMGYNGTGVRIAVLDTGVDITHPALAGKMLTVIPGDPHYPGGWMAFDWDGNPVRTTPHDTHGHGTHCSGTALGGNTVNILIGVAPGAKLMHGLVIPGGSGTFAQVLAGMQWTVEPYYLDEAGNRIYTGLPAHVVSMSLGAHEYYGNELLPAIQAMLLANIVPVAAIGNAGPDTTANPGNIWGVFGIGATDINDYVAYWSSGKVVTWPSPPPTWPFFDIYPSTYIKPDFSAPGVSIRSSVPGGGYADWSGTSMATPHVAGVVALIYQIAGWHLAQIPDIPEKVYLILNSTAVDFGTPGQDIRYGWGRIDAYMAAQKALEYAKKSGVEGYVRDEVTGEPIPWATVTVVETGITVPVTKEGYFRIPLDPGNYTLVIDAWGYQTYVMQVEVVLLNGTITGLVYNALTGVPMPNTSITVVQLNLTTYTDENGVYSVSVPPGTYTLIAEAPGYAPKIRSVTVDEAEVVVVDFPLFPAGNGTIAGYVLHAVTGAPIANATVWTYVDGAMVANITDITGYYELNVPSGNYTVYAYKPGFVGTNVTGVIVSPNTVTWVNFSLYSIPPTVVVLANVDYYTRPHLKDIVAALGLPVVEYTNMTKLLEDWVAGTVNPKVVIIDHTMPSPWSYPPGTVVLAFHLVADASGATLIWLGTSYSGYTGVDVLLLYNTTLVGAGYPAPWSILTGWPSPTYVQVTMLNLTHPIFANVIPDIPPDTFYLGTGYYADYAIYNFTDPTGRFTILAYVNDTRYAHYFGVGVAEWFTNASIPWYYLGSWGESLWMQYLEPGADGMYTDNTKRVLENAILLGWAATPAYVDTLKLVRALELLHSRRIAPVVSPAASIKPQLYTYVEIYMPRLPHGYVTGTVIGSDGVVLEGAKVEFLGTPVTVYTNATGQFYTWLPVGEYIATFSAPGYRSINVSFTIEINVTKDLGIVVLPFTIRVATLYDYADSIKSALIAAGLYAVSYTDLALLIEDLRTGFYHAVVWAGHYGAPFPPCTAFYEFLEVTDSLKIGVVFMDSWGWYGYGIKVLFSCLGDPPVIGYGWGYPVYIVVTGTHPILKGYRVGDVVPIVTYSWADYSMFSGFSGIEIADTLIGGYVIGNAIAWLIRPSGTRWALLSSFAPTQWNLPTFFTEDAWRIIVNAAKWVAARPLNVTLENPYLHVGDVARVLISGAPARAELVVLMNSVEIGKTVADNTGRAVFEFTVPLLPGGEYLIEVMTLDELYYGMTKLYVLPKIVITPKYTTAPGLIYVEATGLLPRQQVHIYLDGNWLSFIAANELGAFSIRLNLPIVVEGIHEIMLVDPVTSAVLASEYIEVSSRLEHIAKTIDDLKSTLLELRPIIVRIDENVATLKTDVGEIKVNVTEIKSFIESSRDAIITEIRNGVAEIKVVVENRTAILSAKLDALDVKITGIKDDIAYLNTSIGEVKVSISELRSLVESSKDAIITEIRNNTATLKLLIENTNVTLITKLDALDAKITSIKGDIAYLNTSLGEVKISLLELKSLVESSRDAVITEIRNGIAEIKIAIENATIHLSARLDALDIKVTSIKDDMAYLNTSIGEMKANLSALKLLIESSIDAVITEMANGFATIRLLIENATIHLSARLDALDLQLLEIRNGIAYLNTSIGEVRTSLSELKSLVESSRDAIITEIRSGVTTVSIRVDNATATLRARLDTLEAKVVEVRDRIILLDTTLGILKMDIQTVRDSLATLNSTIVSITNDIAIIKTAIGELRLKVDDLANALRESNATITGLIIDSTGRVLVQIETSTGTVLADVKTVRDLIERRIPVSTEELRNILDRIIEDLEGLSKSVETVETSSQQAGTYGIAAIGLTLVAIGLLAYLVVGKRK